MGAKNTMRRVLDSALPSGPLWKIAEGDTLDEYFHGLAQNYEDAREAVAAIADLRDAEKTAAVSDLEMEFGITPDTNFTTAQRRACLAALKGERCVLPSLVNLQAKLRVAGYNVYCYPNDPPEDPAPVLSALGGYYLVNGEVLDHQERDYDSTFCDTASDDGEVTFCADDGTEALADRGDTFGAFSGMLRYPYEYKSPTRYRWPMIFWIAGGSTKPTQFDDWNMERATKRAWTAGGDAYLSKSLAWKQPGGALKTGGSIRSLEVMATLGWSDPIGPYAEQLCTADPGAYTVTVYVSASSTVKAGLVVCDKDCVWDTGGIVLSATGSSGETLTYVCANGISGVRLYLTTGSAAPVVGNYARFDNCRVDTAGTGYSVASIHEKWRPRFEKLVLRYKPERTWAGVLIDWTETPPIPGPTFEDDGAP